MGFKHTPSIPLSRTDPPRFGWYLWFGAICIVIGATARGDLQLGNYTASTPLRIMPVGDSITDDCSINGAWRLYLQPFLQTNGYAFTNLGRWVSTPTSTFTKTRHEGICGAVIAFPGMFAFHGYPTLSNYALKTVADALTNTTPDLFLIDLGVNDMGYGRDPYRVATNDMAGLIDLIFAKVPLAQIIVGKPTSITRASIGSPAYSTYATNMPIFCAALQALVNTRRAQGQNVFAADLFSVVYPSLMQGDGTHPGATGLKAMAQEWMFRIAAMTTRSDQVVTPFIGAGSIWKYSDHGLDLGTNWAQPQYDDSTWAAGAARFGYNLPGLTTSVSYGPDSTNKFITTYFRKTFVVPANLHYTNLNLRLNRADSAVVWLNGQELMRVNLPTGPLSFTNQATAAIVGDPAHTYYGMNIPVPFLSAGTNILAVELHKFSPIQPALSFDLELFGMAEIAPPFAASLDGSDLVIRWPETNHSGFVVLSGTDLSHTGTWSPRSGPYITNGGFYEYREPVIYSNIANFYTLRYVGSPVMNLNLSRQLNSNNLNRNVLLPNPAD